MLFVIVCCALCNDGCWLLTSFGAAVCCVALCVAANMWVDVVVCCLGVVVCLSCACCVLLRVGACCCLLLFVVACCRLLMFLVDGCVMLLADGRWLCVVDYCARFGVRC